MKQYILLLLLTGSLLAGEWHVDKAAENLVKFTSEVIVLTFDGTTRSIDGYLYWEGDSFMEKNGQLYFEVDLNTLDTGIGKRDRDMRDVLKTDKFPFTKFESSNVSAEAIDSTVTAYRVSARGKYTVHGVDREREITATVIREASGRLHVVSNFVVGLSDHNIEAPTLAAFVKVNNDIKVHVDFYLSEAKK